MVALVGLGNPGSEYQGTRHNLGFAIIDALARTLRVHLGAGRGDYLVGAAAYRQTTVALVKPMTYMNNSGLAVKEFVDRFHLPLSELLVISDDFHLPLGTLRLRSQGSDGGHNGLYSIIYHLQSEEFPRLRCGIAGATLPQRKNRMAEYVLAPFESDEEERVQSMILRSRDVILEACLHGVLSAMNIANTAQA